MRFGDDGDGWAEFGAGDATILPVALLTYRGGTKGRGHGGHIWQGIAEGRSG
jgi:hypothetical protein